jgi:three-Cys-motif partner protein
MEASLRVMQGPGSDAIVNFVDGFAGPWSVSDATDYSDSSFANAIQVLKEVQTYLHEVKGRRPTIRFVLCEKNRLRFEKLEEFKGRQEGIEIHVFQGSFEDHLESVEPICRTGFTFTFLDPTGWNLRMAEIAAFLTRLKGEFLLNFMSEPINRHAGLTAVERSFGRFLADSDWRSKIEGLPERKQEKQVLMLLKRRMKELGAAKYLPDFPILNRRSDRVQMRLVLGTHHLEGVEVFRTVQKKVENLQLSLRRQVANGGGGSASSLFSEEQLNEMESQLAGVGCARQLEKASESLMACLVRRGGRATFKEVAPLTMEVASVRMTDLKDILLTLRKLGKVAFTLDAAQRKPGLATVIVLPLSE